MCFDVNPLRGITQDTRKQKTTLSWQKKAKNSFISILSV